MTGQKRKADKDIVEEQVNADSIEGGNVAVESTDQSTGSLHIESSFSADQEAEVQQADDECFTSSTPTQNTEGSMSISVSKDDVLDDSVMSPSRKESESSLVENNKIAVPGKSNTVDSNVRVAAKKIKHPSSAWMIFSLENREKIQKDQPSLTFTEVAKSLAEKYRSITAEEKERLEGLAKGEKERYAREVLHAKSIELTSDDLLGSLCQSASADLVLPLGRVKKILKLDHDVKNISKEAIVAITKATELFVAYMGLRCANVATQRGVRTVRDTDLVQTVHTLDSLDFLRMDFPKIPKIAAIAKEKKITKAHPVPSGGAGASIKNFFAGSSSSGGSGNSTTGPSSVTATLSESGAEIPGEIESRIGEGSGAVEMTSEGNHTVDDESSEKVKNISDVLEESERVDLNGADASDTTE